MATIKEVENLIINKIESQDVYNYMLNNNMVNTDELYLIQGSSSTEGAVLPTVSQGDNGKYLRVVNGQWGIFGINNTKGVN